MKNIIPISIAAAVLALATTFSASANTYTNRSLNRDVNRLSNQQQRINAGINDGSINSREAANLYRRESALSATILRDSRNGLSRSERFRINQRFDNISRSIYRDRRN